MSSWKYLLKLVTLNVMKTLQRCFDYAQHDIFRISLILLEHISKLLLKAVPSGLDRSKGVRL